MKKFFLKNGIRGLFSFDPETEEINMSDYIRTNIDWTYVAPEDGEIVCDGVSKSVKKGDVIIQFYKRDWWPNSFVVVKSKEWRANIVADQKHDEEERAKWAAREKCCEPCDDCAACTASC